MITFILFMILLDKMIIYGSYQYTKERKGKATLYIYIYIYARVCVLFQSMKNIQGLFGEEI